MEEWKCGLPFFHSSILPSFRSSLFHHAVEHRFVLDGLGDDSELIQIRKQISTL